MGEASASPFLHLGNYLPGKVLNEPILLIQGRNEVYAVKAYSFQVTQAFGDLLRLAGNTESTDHLRGDEAGLFRVQTTLVALVHLLMLLPGIPFLKET